MLNYDRVKAELAQLKSEQSSGDFVRLLRIQEGLNTFRILPEYDEQGLFFAKAYQHWGIGKGPIPCNLQFDGECYLCQVVQTLYNKSQKQVASRLRATPQYYLNVLDLSSQEALAKGVQVLSVSKKAMTNILAVIGNVAYKGILDVNSGRNIFIDRKGRQSTSTEYTVYPAPEPSAIPNAQELLKGLHRLHELTKPMNNDEIFFPEDFDMYLLRYDKIKP